MSTDVTTGARDLREWRTQERVTVPQPAENVPCAGAWVPTCPCGWAVNLQCTWTLEPPLTVLCRAATSAQRGQPGTGLRPRFRTGTHAFRPICPFCSTALSSPGWTRLIFQGPID
ncbi:hypothetical protein E3U43_017177 [Larimichthys crocea]|uniref:Uncharacterized protein n=1 Tax=Larimichthys crocea TaxID=215358 RepID=A0ACD3QZC0_LARCR|nr:hypothetical protein E3U43_017177 [Larimichthys crocea]